MPCALLYAPVSDGTDSGNRKNALSHASARLYLRLCLREMVGTCGRICRAAAAVGDARHAPMFPDAVSMAVELAVYGFAAALVYDLLPKKLPYTYVSLISAMLCGRVAWGAMRYVIAGISKTKFTFPMFLAGAFTRAFPGIIVQLLLVPAVIELLRRTGNISRERNPERVAAENPLQAIDK